MGARLQYAKVIDRQLYYERGARIHPGLDSEIVLNGEPGVAGAFLVLRAWTEDHGTFTEQWHIETPGGSRVYQSTPRELHLATTSHVEHLEDEVADLKLDYAADGYRVVFKLDEHVVAAVDVPVNADHLADDAG
ncbi:MAG TPA: hypothetical protein VM784_10200 [Actinomycetota bacterium]|nr:hypothetical protein [Actinomycetota bacterium]